MILPGDPVALDEHHHILLLRLHHFRSLDYLICRQPVIKITSGINAANIHDF